MSKGNQRFSIYNAQMAGVAFIESLLTQMALKGITEADLAERLGRSLRFVRRVFKTGQFTFDLACQFAAAVGLYFIPTLARDQKAGLERGSGLLDDLPLVQPDDVDVLAAE